MEIEQVDRIRKARFASFCIGFCLPIIIGFTVVDFFEGDTIEALINLLMISILVIGFVSLKKIKAHKLKIDQEFIHDMFKDASNLEIIRATIALGHALGLEILAEGVETDKQLRKLKELDCDSAQGYLFSPPKKEAELVAAYTK